MQFKAENEVVCLDADIPQETAENVDHIVGVNGGEDQGPVSGELMAIWAVS